VGGGWLVGFVGAGLVGWFGWFGWLVCGMTFSSLPPTTFVTSPSFLPSFLPLCRTFVPSFVPSWLVGFVGWVVCVGWLARVGGWLVLLGRGWLAGLVGLVGLSVDLLLPSFHHLRHFTFLPVRLSFAHSQCPSTTPFFHPLTMHPHTFLQCLPRLSRWCQCQHPPRRRKQVPAVGLGGWLVVLVGAWLVGLVGHVGLVLWVG